VRDRVGVCMVDGGVTLFHVPEQVQTKPGQPRKRSAIRFLDETVAAAVFQKTLGTIAVHGNNVFFSGFPGQYFCNRVLRAPERDQFLAVPGTARWAAAFHLVRRKQDRHLERVLMLDKARRLVRWAAEWNAGGKSPGVRTDFKVVAENVIGAIQQGSRVLFAAGTADGTQIHSLSADGGPPVRLATLPHVGDLLLFGDPRAWPVRQLYAVRQSRDTWLFGVGHSAAKLRVDGGATVLGVARMGPDAPPGLVVLDSTRTRIDLLKEGGRTALVKSPEPIAQASFDPEFQRIAWLQQASGVLNVQRLGEHLPLLRTLPRGGAT